MDRRIAPLTVALAVVATSIAGCGVFGGKHKVGECVHTRASLGGTEITSADCPTGKSAFSDQNVADPVYRITSVLDYEAHCPNPEGFGDIELKHEPDDAVYCLTLALG